MDCRRNKVIAHLYVKKERYETAYPWFKQLQEQGLNPVYITTDGHPSIIRALRTVWPLAKLQRCLYHIQREGCRWLRTYPKTGAGVELKKILLKLSSIKTKDEQNQFIESYKNWLKQYKDFVVKLPRTTVASKDLKRTMTLINNALPNMFHFLDDSNIYATTNALEGYHSMLKSDYQRHRGLSKQHRISYINWYNYFKNSNTF